MCFKVKKNIKVKIRGLESPDVTSFRGSVTYFSIPDGGLFTTAGLASRSADIPFYHIFYIFRPGAEQNGIDSSGLLLSPGREAIYAI